MGVVADVQQQLFHAIPRERMRVFSFGHIVPPANLLPVVIGQVPSNQQARQAFPKPVGDLLVVPPRQAHVACAVAERC